MSDKKLYTFPHYGACFHCSQDTDLNAELTCEACQRALDNNYEDLKKLSDDISEKSKDRLLINPARNRY